MWSVEHSVDTTAPAEAVWQVWQDTSRWPEWNLGVGAVELDGAFATGATGRLTPRGQEPLPFTVVSAEPGRGYVSETAIAETVTMRTTQRLEALPAGGSRIHQTLSLHGPAADIFGQSFGPAFAAGVPDTMSRLAARAQQTNLSQA